MGKFLNKYFWTILVVFAALGLASSSAYFSISGLSKLFAGSALQVIIMASFIEFAKIGTTATLHRYWRKMKGFSMTLFKWTLTMMVIVVMIITSSGIYGFLADAYSSTAIELKKISGKIELVEKKQEQKREKIVGINETKELKITRIKSLVELRNQQENRIDSLQAKGWYNSAKRARKSIERADEEITNLGREVDSLISKLDRVNDDIGLMNIEKLNLENSDVATEIGPLKYMSTVIGRPIENIINWFILMIIIVFDPMAVLLIIFANIIYDRANKKDVNNSNNNKIKSEKKHLKETISEKKDVTKKEENYKKIIDAVNNTDSNIFDYSYDFQEVEEEKGGEVVEYVESENGIFKKSDEENKKNIESIIKNIDSNPVYLRMIDVLFLNGERGVGDVIPPYLTLMKDISNKNINVDEKTIKSFLIICNLLGITNMKDKNNVKIIKDFETSKNIISLVSK